MDRAPYRCCLVARRDQNDNPSREGRERKGGAAARNAPEPAAGQQQISPYEKGNDGDPVQSHELLVYVTVSCARLLRASSLITPQCLPPSAIPARSSRVNASGS